MSDGVYSCKVSSRFSILGEWALAPVLSVFAPGIDERVRSIRCAQG